MRRTYRLLAALVLSGIASTAGATCAPAAATLCLNGKRFRVEVVWKDFQDRTGAGEAVPITSDTGYFWFFSPSNVELVVKVVDGRGFNGRYWVFFGALSNVEYDLTVTDTSNGASKTYHNPAGQFASVGDTAAFPDPGIARSHSTVTVEGRRTGPASLDAIRDLLEPRAASTQDFTECPGADTNLSLNGCRFLLQVTWTDSQGHSGHGQAKQLTDDTGYFWFFSASNVELVVKVLDARTFNGHFWVFFGALTNVEYRLTVFDTLTGVVSVYDNPSGRFASTGDTAAFPSSPSVVTVPDEARAVSAEIPPEGGSLTATAADGTTFLLEIPADALVFPQRISMTPISSVDGLPFSGGFAGAVKLEPEGLFLWQRASLTIQPASALPRAQVTSFLYRGAGEELIRYPLDPRAQGIVLPVFRLAGYGIVSGASVQRLRASAAAASGSLDVYVQRAAVIVAKQMAGEISSEERVARMNDLFSEAWTAVVEPQLNALSGCEPAVIESTLLTAVTFLRSVAVWGDDPSRESVYREVIYTTARAAILRCIDEAYRRCKNNNDPGEVRFIFALLRAIQKTGLIDDDDFAQIFEKIEKCLRFEIDFESSQTVETLVGSGGTHRLKVRAVVPVRLEYEEHYFLSGSGPIRYEYVNLTLPDVSCSVSIPTTEGVFAVERISLGGEGFPPRAQLAIDMVYRPGDPQENHIVTCPFGTSQSGFQSQFGPAYAAMHLSEAIPGSFTYVASRWEPVLSGSFLAKKTYERAMTFDNLRLSEETFIFLKHTPE